MRTLKILLETDGSLKKDHEAKDPVMKAISKAVYELDLYAKKKYKHGDSKLDVLAAIFENYSGIDQTIQLLQEEWRDRWADYVPMIIDHVRFSKSDLFEDFVADLCGDAIYGQGVMNRMIWKELRESIPGTLESLLELMIDDLITRIALGIYEKMQDGELDVRDYVVLAQSGKWPSDLKVPRETQEQIAAQDKVALINIPTLDNDLKEKYKFVKNLRNTGMFK